MKKNSKKRLSKIFNFIGNTLIALALIVFVLTMGPVAREEVKYSTKEFVQKATNSEIVNKEIEPPNKDFSLVIPKIEAVAPVFTNINPYDEKGYLGVLRKGVAHARGSALPGEAGNVYIFAHSTDAFYNVGRYNAVFYLLGKLQKDDEVYIYYKGEKLTYKVLEVKVVSPFAVKYLGDLGIGHSLTLQTCYPPGTTLKRLVVVSKQVDSAP